MTFTDVNCPSSFQCRMSTPSTEIPSTSAANSAVLEFAAEVDGIAVEGVDILHWNDEGQLTSVKVMVRPFKAIQTVVAKMAELLAAQ